MKSIGFLFLSLLVLSSCQKKADDVTQDDCAQYSIGSSGCPTTAKIFYLQEPTQKLDLELWQLIDGVTVKTAKINFSTGEAVYSYADVQNVPQTKTIILNSNQLIFAQSHLRNMAFCEGITTNTLSHLDACFASPIRLKLEMQSTQVLDIEYGGAFNFCDNYAGVSDLARSLSLFLISSPGF